MTPPARSLVPLLAACSTTGPIATNLFLPALPAVSSYFGVPVAAAQTTLSAYLIAFAVGILITGPLADRYGRRPVLVAGMGIFAISSLLALLAPSLSALIAARVVQGLAAASGITVARATVGDLYQGAELARRIAMLTMAMIAGTVLSPWLGGLLITHYGWRAGFVAMAAGGVAIFLATWRLMPETRAATTAALTSAQLWSQGRAVLRQHVFLGYAIQSGVIYSIFLVFISVAPFLMVGVLGRPATDFGLYYVLLAGGYFLGNYYVSSRARPGDVQRLITTGLVLQAGGAALALGFALAGLWHPLLLFGPMFPLSIGQGLALPNITARAVSMAPGYTGMASGLIGFLQTSIAAFSVQAMGWASTTTPLPVTLFCALAAVLATVSSFVLRAQLPRKVA